MDEPAAETMILASIHMWHGMAECTRVNELTVLQLARDIGLSWAKIGEAVGMTRQSAQKRFGPLLREGRRWAEVSGDGDGEVEAEAEADDLPPPWEGH